MPYDGTMGSMSAARNASGRAGDRHAAPSRSLGRYRIAERIGSGGTADVFRAEVEGASGFAKTLVVKCLRPALADEPELAQALEREAKLAQRLHHGNIVQVLDYGVEDGQPYVVMEHVDGCSLHELQRDLGRRGERIGLPEALFVVEELAAALRYAHGLTDDEGTPLHLVHRDVKPRNVLVSREGVIKLTDFGIAKASDDLGDTLPGVVKGTPAYLAPEQARGHGVDGRTDVFALGLVLRELVEGDDDADPALHQLWQRATADAPEQRFSSMQALMSALQRWRATRGLDAVPGRLPAWVRRARRQAPASVAVSLDAALLGSRPHDVTLTSAAPPGAPPVHAAATGLHRGWLALAVGFALGGVALALWPGARPTPTPAPHLASAPASSTPASSTPERAIEPAPLIPLAPTVPALASETTPTHELTAAQATTSGDPAAPPEVDPPARRRAPAPATAEPGRLQVNVLPWAEVSVDGHPKGRVPLDIELSAGPHRVQLSNPQLGERILEIDVPAGGVHKISRW